MTLDELQQAIQVLYENSTDFYAEGSEDWVIRLNLINLWISRWENVDGTFWNELWTSDSSRTFAFATPSYAAPAAMKMPGGFIKVSKAGVGELNVPVVPQHKAAIKGAGEVYAVFTGRPGAYEYAFGGVGEEFEGAKITFPYYKFATKLAMAADITEVPDPTFLVQGTVADLHSMNRNISGYDLRVEQAEERLSQMQLRNEISPHYQNNQIEDREYELFGGGFGY